MIFSRIIKGSGYEDVPIVGAMEVRFEHGGDVFVVGTDRHGRLFVRTMDGRLLVQPEASNHMILRSERSE